MPPANIDMSAIREAMARRSMGGGGAPAGGTTMPAIGQQAAPGGMTPAGGPNTPATAPPQTPPAQGGTMPRPPAGAPQGAPQQGQPQRPQGPASFDDDTKVSAKALMQQLLKYM